MKRTKKVLGTLLVVGVTGTLVVLSTFSAFSSTTENPGNEFAAGSVALSDNDGGTALYNVSNKRPGDFAERCIKVTYTGTLGSSVKLYRSGFSGGSGLDSYIDLAITKGTGTAGDCSDFSGSTSVYSGTLNGFASTAGTAVALTNGSGQASWSQNDAVTYKVRATLQNNDAAQGLATGTHSLIFQSQSD